MARDYRGKTALITGASSGIGVEFANQQISQVVWPAGFYEALGLPA